MKIKFLFFQILLIFTFKGFAQSSEMWYLDLWDEDDLKFNDSLIKSEQIKSAIVLKFILAKLILMDCLKAMILFMF